MFRIGVTIFKTTFQHRDLVWFTLICPETSSESTCVAQTEGSVDHSKSTVLKWGQVGSHDASSSATIALKGYNGGGVTGLHLLHASKIIAYHCAAHCRYLRGCWFWISFILDFWMFNRSTRPKMMIPKWILYVSGLKPPTGHRLDRSAVSASGCAWGFHGWFRQGTSRRCSIRRMMLCLFPETLIPMSIICYHFFMPYPLPYSAHIPNNIEKRTSKTTHFSGHFRCVTQLFSQAIYIPPGWWHSIRTHRPPPCHDGLPQMALSSPKKLRRSRRLVPLETDGNHWGWSPAKNINKI